MTVALIGALLLLFGSLKVCFWLSERLVKRQVSYEETRVSAGSQDSLTLWEEPDEPLKIFNE